MARARAAAERAYAPYSEFPVGAALITSSGHIFDGANIENASYGLTVCAERVAIFRAVLDGCQEIAAIAVHAPKERPCPPCGACRQVLNEFRAAGGDVIVVLEGADGVELHTLDELLPMAFGPRNVKGDS